MTLWFSRPFSERVPWMTLLLLTMVDDEPQGADVFFPACDGFVVRSESETVEENGIRYRVVEMVRSPS